MHKLWRCKMRCDDFKDGFEEIRVVIFKPRVRLNENLTDDGLENFFSDLSSGRLIHDSAMYFTRNERHDDGPDLCHLGDECGGDLVIDFTREKEGRVWIECTNRECGLKRGYIRLGEGLRFRDLMLHLMLKQLVPRLASLNYIDCSLAGEELTCGKRENILRTRSLGVISVSRDTVSLERAPLKYSLGFSLGRILGEDMKRLLLPTRRSPIVNRWLDLLIYKKFAQLAEAHRALTPSLLGPKVG